MHFSEQKTTPSLSGNLGPMAAKATNLSSTCTCPTGTRGSLLPSPHHETKAIKPMLQNTSFTHTCPLGAGKAPSSPNLCYYLHSHRSRKQGRFPPQPMAVRRAKSLSIIQAGTWTSEEGSICVLHFQDCFNNTPSLLSTRSCST